MGDHPDGLTHLTPSHGTPIAWSLLVLGQTFASHMPLQQPRPLCSHPCSTGSSESKGPSPRNCKERHAALQRKAAATTSASHPTTQVPRSRTSWTSPAAMDLSRRAATNSRSAACFWQRGVMCHDSAILPLAADSPLKHMQQDTWLSSMS